MSMQSVDYWERELAYQQANLAYEQARYDRALSGNPMTPLPPMPWRSTFHAVDEVSQESAGGFDAKMRTRGWTEEGVLALGMFSGLAVAAGLLFGCIALLPL